MQRLYLNANLKGLIDELSEYISEEEVMKFISNNFTVTDELLKVIADRINLGANESITLLVGDAVEGLLDSTNDLSERVGKLSSTQSEMSTYLQLIPGEGVYVGYPGGNTRAFIDQYGWFKVMIGDRSVTAMGPNQYQLGELVFYNTGSSVAVRRVN